jgi:hypothetical protein
MMSNKGKNITKNKKKKSVDVETVWKDYTAALVKWKLAYELWQKAGKEALINYMHVIQSLGPKIELPKQMSKTWEKALMESGVEQIEQFGKEWQNMVRASGLESLVKFNKDWEKFWKSPGFDASKTYAEALKQYTETWQSMWKK